jgi:predicted glycosyltransferase
MPYADIARRSGCTVLLTDHELSDERPRDGTGLRVLSRAERMSLGLRYEDLVAAADVVVSKPGYGIVSECVANRTALLFTSRGKFAEQDVFLREMPRVLRCAHIAPEDLKTGAWDDRIRALLEQPAPPESLPTNGGEIAAAEILSFASTDDEHQTR